MEPYVPQSLFRQNQRNASNWMTGSIQPGNTPFVHQFNCMNFYEYLILNLIKENQQIKHEINNLKSICMDSLISEKLTKSNNLILKLQRCKRKYHKKEGLIQKKYKCQHQECERFYSSKIALNSHLRKKHSIKSDCSVEF